VDLGKRIKFAESTYQPLDDSNDNESYITLNNNGNKLITNKIHGYIVGKIVFFVMSFRASQNDIYISRHGESVYNLTDRLGGDSSLSGTLASPLLPAGLSSAASYLCS
jgi:hypothetical protein